MTVIWKSEKSCIISSVRAPMIQQWQFDELNMFAIAVENVQKMKRSYRLEFLRSCVIYLRSNRNTPDSLEIEIIFPDGHTHTYEIPTIKLDNYTKDGIFEKNLLMLYRFML